jgi:glucose-6-phosphate dehydrogenase assembly protein OpcA
VTSNDIERFTSGHAVGVDVGAIERDLASLWRKASQADATVSRACSWNLVVSVGTDAELVRGKALVDALVAVVPSRTVVVNHRPGASGPELEAYVTANCRLNPGGGKMVCTEEITIEARGRGGELLPALLRALLVPDIPSAVLWAGLPHTSAVMDDLLIGAERVVLDSTRADELTQVERLGPKVTSRVADLNWLRGSPLRRVVAVAFDGANETPMLFRLRRVQLECAPEAVSAAKLLLGWLASRLSWGAPERSQATDSLGWTVARAQGQVVVDLHTTPGAPGISALSFEGERGERVKLVTHPGAMSIESTFGSPRAMPFQERPDESLVVAALGHRGADRLYQSALTRAVELER